MIYDLGPHRVQTVGDDFYVAPNAAVIGRVHLGRDASVWFSAVLRGDGNDIRIGDRSNVQDLTIIHVMRDTHPTLIGHDVSIGHGAVIHGCTIEDRCLIGMGAILLNGVVVGTGSIVAAGALVPEGMVIPPGSMVMGMPAKVKRTLSADEQASIQWYADNYVRYRLDFQDASSS